MSLISGANLDAHARQHRRALRWGGSGMNDLLKAGTSSLVPALFGDKSGALVNALSSASGIKSSSATNLLAMVVPLVLMFLKKFIGDKGLDANSLSTLLGSQGPNLQGALDSRLTSALGFASPAAFLGGLGGRPPTRRSVPARPSPGGAGAAASTAAAATRDQVRPDALAALDHRRGGAAAPVEHVQWQVHADAAPAPVLRRPRRCRPAAAPVGMTLPAKVYFDVGAAAIGADGSNEDRRRRRPDQEGQPQGRVTGYTDKTGDVAKNEELAKSRAMAVRDALKAAGVAEANLETKPPMFVEVGTAGGDAEARRVEISKQ